MSRYRIVESVGTRVEHVHRYEDLEIHHPSANARGVRTGRTEDFENPRTRDYGRVNGEYEEIRRTDDGRALVKKDFVLSQDIPGPVNVPSPVDGYLHYLRGDPTAAVRIYDRPFGQPGARLLGQVLHMDPESFRLREGAQVRYGQPLGVMSDTGTPGAIHAHVEVEATQFRRYVADIDSGTIAPGRYPGHGSPAPAQPAAASTPRQLDRGDQGADVTALQHRLNRLGYRDAEGSALATDGDFGQRTERAVQAFQRASGIEVDGVVGSDTRGALNQARPRPQPSSPPSQTDVTQHGPTALSNLIGSGEGGYNSYNRGRAGNAGGREIDFSQMTLAEVMRRQSLPRTDPQYLFAVGKFQMIPGTMRETVGALGLDRDQHFTPALQERMFADYLVDEKRPAVHAYITGQRGGADGLRRAQVALAQEFASVADPRTGRSYYDGDSAGNSASITSAQAAAALGQMQREYSANIRRGLSPDAAYRALGGDIPDSSREAGRQPDSNSLLRQGDQGPDVHGLQQSLNKLGFRDNNGRSLAEDSDYGRCTREAVEAFQRANGLEVDGIAGPDTLARIGERLPQSGTVTVDAEITGPVVAQARTLADPGHTAHALYRQAYDGLRDIDAQRLGFRSEQDYRNAAGTLAFEARVSGLGQIDHVLANRDGSGLFAVQGRLDDPGHRRLYVDKDQAVAQPLERSTQQLEQETGQQADREQQQQRRAVLV